MGFLVSSAIEESDGSRGVIHNVNYVLVSDPWLLRPIGGVSTVR